MAGITNLSMIASVLLLFLLYDPAHSYPSGAPFKACANLYPKHGGTAPQTTPSPFKITFEPAFYSPGDEITVTIKDPNGTQKFKGFQIRARRTTGDTEELVGDFSSVSPGLKKQFWYPQEENYTNCVTHASRDEKTDVILKWTAPPISLGDVRFRATFVQSYKTFWVDVESDTLKGNETNPNTNVDWEVGTSFGELQLDGACHQTKGCLYFPTFCTGNNCNYVVTYQRNNTEVTFEIKAKAAGYVTMALSADKFMGNDEAVTCVNSGTYVSVQYGFNPAYYNDRHSIKGFRNIQTKNQDGFIYCRFTRPLVRSLTHLVEQGGSVSKVIHTFDLNTPYYIFLAYGDIYPGADVLSKHKEHPIITKDKVDFSKNTIVRADSLPLYTKIHMALMVGAWMLFALIGISTARYFKDGFNGAEIMGIKTWFHLHRFCALLAAACSIAAFVLIFVHLKAWTKYASIHAGIGISVMVFLTAQIVGGMIRPGPNDPMRPLFTTMHGMLGLLAALTSAATMIAGVRIPLINSQLQLWLTITIPVWVGLNLFSIFLFEGVRTHKLKLKNRVHELDLNIKRMSMNGDDVTKSSFALTTTDDEGELERIQKPLHFTYGLYCFMLLAFTAITITFIFLF